TVTKSSLTFGGGNAWTAGANAAGYAGSKDGKMLVEAFVMAFNALSAQSSVIAAVPKSSPVVAAEPGASVAIDTVLRAGPSGEAAEVRTLRAGTELKRTGQ